MRMSSPLHPHAGFSTDGTLALLAMTSLIVWVLVSAPFRARVEGRFEELTT